MALKDNASLALIPAAYKTSKVYSAIPTNGDGDFTFSRSGTGATRINKAGLVETMGTNVPRLNYDLTNGTPASCPNLLLEPSRANLITQSTELTSGALAKVNLTVSNNTSIVDPKGNTNTKTLTATSTSQPRLEWRGTSVPGSNTSYAMSFWVRYNTARYVAIAHFSQTGEYAIFDLVSGEVESDVGTQTAKIEAYPNDWYRISKSFVVPSSASLNYWKFTLCTQTNAFVGVNGQKADVFGLQLEAGSYPTSLIPTSGLAVTRTADNCKIDSGLAAYIGNPLGTFFVDVEFDRIGTSSSYGRFVLSDQTSNVNRIIIDNYNGNIRAAVVYSGGSISVGNVSQVSGTRYKLAFSYKSGYNTFCINGTNYNNTGAYTLTADMESIKFSDYGGTNNRFQGKLHQLMVFNTALTDAELITLTT